MGRLTRKQRKEGSLKKKFRFGHVDDQVMKRWDHSKTALENFALMGLQYNNKFVSENQKALDKLGMEAKPVDLTVPEEIKAKERGVNFHLQHYIRPLIIKYKEDYEKMKMDHKLNFYQKTATELEKLAKKFIVLYGHPLYGDVYQQQKEEQERLEREEKERLEREEQERIKKEEELKLQQEKKKQQTLNKKSITTTKSSKSSQPIISKSNNSNNTTTTNNNNNNNNNKNNNNNNNKSPLSKKVTKTPSTTVSKPKQSTTTSTTIKKVIKSK